MRTHNFRFLTLLALSMPMLARTAALASRYDTAVLRDRPSLYLPLKAPAGSATERDISGNGHTGTYRPTTHGSPPKTTLPNGDSATVFNGSTQYLEVNSAAALSVKHHGALTIEAWIRPDTLQFPNSEKDGYVYWMGKGETGQYEYAGRMYSKTNSAHRPNRISGYAFNLTGSYGSGSYFQDVVQKGEWIYVVIIIDARPQMDSVSIYKNGVLRKTTPLSQFNVTPEPGTAPLRVATRDLNSFFKGAMGKFAVYDFALSETKIKAHYLKMQ